MQIERQVAMKAVWAWMRTYPFLATHHSGLIGAPTEREALDVLRQLAQMRTDGWLQASPEVRRHTSTLAVELVGRIMGMDPANATGTYRVPDRLTPSELGGQIIAFELDQHYPPSRKPLDP